MKMMIVDDSLTYRLVLKEVARQLPGAEVLATAVNGRDALQKLDEIGSIDLMLLDLQMPVMDGMQTLNEVKSRFPGTNVVMISGFNMENADLTIKALELGAVDFIRKPDSDSAQQNFLELCQQLEAVMLTCQKKRSTTPEHPGKIVSPLTRMVPLSNRNILINIVVIGISTGGPNALLSLIPRLPGNLGVPVLIVQHMPPLFTKSLAENLNAKSALLVKEAEDNEIINKNTVYIAPGGRHMALRSNQGVIQIALNDFPPENSCRPAVDVMFRSVAEVYGGNVLAIMMTGMGCDGALGMKQLKEKRAYCISQTAESCVIYGMPRAVDELGIPDEHVSLEEIPSRVVALVQSYGRGIR